MPRGRGLQHGSVLVRGFEGNAAAAIAASPRYFTWWYTVKSIALVGAIGTAAYYAGKASAK